VILSSKHLRRHYIRADWENSTAFVYHLRKKKIEVLLSKTKGLYPAQTGLGRVVGFNADSQELYMPAFTGGLRSKPRYDLYKVRLKNGKGKIHAKGRRSTVNWFVDKKGNVLAREDFDKNAKEHRVFSKASGKWQLIYSHKTAIPAIYLQAVSADNSQLLFVGGDGNNESIFSMSLVDGDIQGPIYQREHTDVGFMLTDINRKLVAVKYNGFTPSYHFANKEDNQTFTALHNHFPISSVEYLARTTDQKKWLIRVSGNDGAGAYKMLDRGSFGLRSLVAEYPAITSIGEIKAVNIRARGGMNIPSIITLPTDASKRENLPLIALPHGGPASHDTLRFDWLAQYLAAKGYAVLQTNFRGSTGFGIELRDSGNGQWGKKMQDDVSDGVAARVNAGYVDPDRVCIMGASYGGYSALAGGAFSPELYRCIIAIAGVSDIPLMLKSGRVRFGTNHWVVSYWEKIIGDSKTEREKLKSISPVNFAQQFQTPVLLLHGNDDTVVPIRQSKTMLKALKKANKNVKFVELQGEDHWLSRSGTRLAMLEAVSEFLDQHNPSTIH